MGFISPIAAWIAAGITVPLLVSLYFLKLRRREVSVSSTLLWRKAIQDLQVNAPFQRIRKNLLLLLQLLVLLGLLLGFARPTVRGQAHPGQRMVIMIDHSASMNASDISPTRLDRAKELAMDLIDGLGSDSDPGNEKHGAMVIAFAQGARVVQPFTSDVNLLRDAVRSIQPTDQSSHLGPGLRLIEPFSQIITGGNSAATGSSGSLVAYVLSDGKVSDRDKLGLSGVDLRFVRIGEETDNLAIASLSARRDYKKPQIVQVFTSLANYSPAPVDTHLTLSLDERVQRVVPVTVPGFVNDRPGIQSVQFDFTLPGNHLLELRHDHVDALSADDAARLIVSPPKRVHVLLVTNGNAFLERVIESVGVRKLVTMTPRKYEDQSPQYLRRHKAGSEEIGFDVIVFDGYAPETVPVVQSLYLGSAPPIDGLGLIPWKNGTPTPRTQAILQWKRDHPMLQYVSLDDVLLVESGRLVLPDSGQVLATSQSGPIIADINHHEIHHVVIGFELFNSNWPMQISFPVCVSNTVRWLGLGGQTHIGFSYRPGEVAVIPAGNPGGLEYVGPQTLVTAEIGGGGGGGAGSIRSVLPMFERVGLYRTEQPVPRPWDRLAVNLFDPVESDLRLVDQLEIGSIPVAADKDAVSIRREIWPWFVGAGMVVLMIEWVVYTRRMHL